MSLLYDDKDHVCGPRTVDEVIERFTLAGRTFEDVYCMCGREYRREVHD